MYFGGYIRAHIKTQNIGFFINECQREGCRLCRVTKCDDGWRADVSSRQYTHLVALADKFGAELKINSRLGLMMKLFLYKSRKILILFFLFLSLYYSVNYCYISDICISGNNIYTDSQILACLRENGIYVGKMKFGIDPKKVQQDFVKDFSDVSWIWIEIDGTKAIVNLRERITVPEFFDYNNYGNVVAERDGIIQSAIASSGTTLVSEGMFVRKGDILIGGVYDFNELAPIRFVSAGGRVTAKTYYTIEDKFGCEFVRYSLEDEPKSRLSFYMGNLSLGTLSKDSTIMSDFNKKDIRIKIFGKNYLPLGFTKSKYCEIIDTRYTLSKEELKKYAFDELAKRLRQQLPSDAKINNATELVLENYKDGILASVTFECIEDIAGFSPILVDNEGS